MLFINYVIRRRILTLQIKNNYKTTFMIAVNKRKLVVIYFSSSYKFSHNLKNQYLIHLHLN